ncbi:MAG: sulfate permease [Ectothiorhodospiraceae bacterium]|nr:sulfate permease [Ectothiorhodospiraceae bacterium]
MPPKPLSHWLPILDWLPRSRGAQLRAALLAGVITALLLVPQGMALALLAGLPPIVGLYAGILPPLVYALFGTSRTLAVGPVSVAALLVANALAGTAADPGSAEWLQGAITLAALSAGILLLMGLLRLGELANFLSHPVLSGFTSGAAVIIIVSQLPQLTGIALPRDAGTLTQLGHLFMELPRLDPGPLIYGVVALLLLLMARKAPLLKPLARLGIPPRATLLASRTAPLMVVLGATAIAAFTLPLLPVAVVGDIPAGLPVPSLQFLAGDHWLELLPAALVISIIGYVESVSVARVLAWRRRERVDPNRELIALGASNAGAALTGTMPVAGGFARSMVNFEAGARSQLAGIVTALLVALSALLFTPVFRYLPLAVLAAVIIAAVIPLIDVKALKAAWRFDHADGLALMVTFLGVVLVDIELGLAAGLLLSVGTFLWRTGHPHAAVVGRVPGTEHFRNEERHHVETWPHLLLLRMDESLYFANTAFLEQVVARRVAERPELQHVVLICSAVNRIDHSALETLEQLAENLALSNIVFHLAEVKGPVMDRLRGSGLLEAMGDGRVFLSSEEAVEYLGTHPRPNGNEQENQDSPSAENHP